MPICETIKSEPWQGVARGLTATKAYIEAGYSKNGAGAGASRLLADSDVHARIDELLAEQQEVNKAATERAIEHSAVTKEWVLATWSRSSSATWRTRFSLIGKPASPLRSMGPRAVRAGPVFAEGSGQSARAAG
jgi:hypothetical protein